jgi:hypothetical protein
MTIGISLDDRHHIHVWSNQVFYDMKICSKRVEIDLSPSRPMMEQHWLFV